MSSDFSGGRGPVRDEIGFSVGDDRPVKSDADSQWAASARRGRLSGSRSFPTLPRMGLSPGREGGERRSRTGPEHELRESLDGSDRVDPPPELLGQGTEAPLEILQEDSAGLREGVLLPFLAPLLQPL